MWLEDAEDSEREAAAASRDTAGSDDEEDLAAVRFCDMCWTFWKGDGERRASGRRSE